jgi:four helix bundle protein
MRDHSRLTAFQLADQLALAVYSESKAFPRNEQFGLTSQVRRAAVSVPANIVEGCARSSENEYIRFLEIAYASASELQYELSLCERLGYLTDQGANHLTPLCDSVLRTLSGLIKALRSYR